MTNSLKAGIIAALNGAFGVAIAFDVPLTEIQIGAINVFVNAILGLWVALTYKNSPSRIPDAGDAG